MRMAKMLVMYLLLLSSACGFLEMSESDRTTPRPRTSRTCALTWDMYSSSDKKIDTQLGEFFDLSLKLKKGKTAEEGCEFVMGGGAGFIVYQWQAEGHGRLKGIVVESFLQGEIVQDKLKFSNLIFFFETGSWDSSVSAEDYKLPLRGKLTATAVPYVEDNSGSTDSKQPFVLTKNRGVAGEMKFNPAKDAFLFSVKNGKANSDYKITIATNAENNLLDYVKKSLEKEITLDGNGQGQFDVPIFSRECVTRAIARMTRDDDDRIIALYTDFPRLLFTIPLLRLSVEMRFMFVRNSGTAAHPNTVSYR